MTLYQPLGADVMGLGQLADSIAAARAALEANWKAGQVKYTAADAAVISDTAAATTVDAREVIARVVAQPAFWIFSESKVRAALEPIDAGQKAFDSWWRANPIMRNIKNRPPSEIVSLPDMRPKVLGLYAGIESTYRKLSSVIKSLPLELLAISIGFANTAVALIAVVIAAWNKVKDVAGAAFDWVRLLAYGAIGLGVYAVLREVKAK